MEAELWFKKAVTLAPEDPSVRDQFGKVAHYWTIRLEHNYIKWSHQINLCADRIHSNLVSKKINVALDTLFDEKNKIILK